MPWTNLHKNIATTTWLFVCNFNHETNLFFKAQTLATINCLSLDVHPTYSIDNMLETTLVVPTAKN